MLKVRAMTIDDIDSVHAIETSSHLSPWSYGILRDCVLVGYNCQVLEEEIAPAAPQIVGYMICRHSYSICHILNICIDFFHQGKGFGRYLIQELINSLMNSPIQTLMLEVRPSNKVALALYESFSFEKDGVKKEYYTDKDGKTEDALVLKKQLR